MIKPISLPCFCIRMASLASGLSVFLKLAIVDIGMAFPAFTGQTVESLFIFHLSLDRGSSEMTITTGSRSMPPLQCISGSYMIKVDGCPIFLRVAGPAIGSGIIFTADLSGVDILMTSDTGGSNVSECPLPLFQMTIITGRRHMRTTKRKRRCLVLIERISCLGERLFQCVTFLAITRRLRLHEFALMIVGMAISTQPKFHRFRVTPCLMAFATFNALVHALQRITGDIMIE